MKVSIEWTSLHQETNRLWSDNCCLYAYLHPTRDWLLYMGKADYCDVRSRMRGDHKGRLFDDIEDEYRIDADDLRVLHGYLDLAQGLRFSSALLSDVESLMIKRLQPYGNIACRDQRISRPGLQVECVGDWPIRRRRFRDDY